MARSRSPGVTKQLSSFGSCRATAVWINPRIFKGTNKKCLSDSCMDLTGKRREGLQHGSLLTLSEITLL